MPVKPFKRGPSSTHSLPQSNLAVMCCLTSLMRSWVRWPTSTCLLRSKISFITCQSRWNKSPSFFCGSGKQWRWKKKKKKRKKTVERNTQRRRLKVEIDRRGTTEWGWRMERKMQIRRYCCFGPPESENGVRGKHISAYSTFRKKRGDPERGADRAT